MTPHDTIHPKEDVTIWKEQVQGSSVSVRGRGKINAPYDVVMGLIRDSEQKKTWDEQFISADVIDDRLPTTRVQTESFRGIWYEYTLYVHLFCNAACIPSFLPAFTNPHGFFGCDPRGDTSCCNYCSVSVRIAVLS